MKKIVITCLLITITLSTIIFLTKKDSKESEMFAILLETEAGSNKYSQSKDNRWPTSDEYVINMYKTNCEQGSILRWNIETKKINAK